MAMLMAIFPQRHVLDLYGSTCSSMQSVTMSLHRDAQLIKCPWWRLSPCPPLQAIRNLPWEGPRPWVRPALDSVPFCWAKGRSDQNV